MGSTEFRSLLARAEGHLANSDFPQAEKLALKAIAADAPGALPYCILGSCCTFTGRTSEALHYFEQAIEIAEHAGDGALHARALNGIAIVHRSDQLAAIPFAERALAIAQAAPDSAQQAKALNILGSLHTDLADYAHALEFYTKALALAETMGDKQSIAAYLGNIGNVHRILAEYSRALDYFARALAIAERIPNEVLVQRNLHLIGEVHSAMADHVRALDFLGRALVLAEQLGNRVNTANLLMSIGIVHSGLADYARALDYYDRAITLAEAAGDKFGYAACLDNIGSVYWHLADYARALDYFSRALAIAEEIGAATLIANQLGNTGIVYKDSGDHVRALDYLQRALIMSRESGDRSQTGHWMHGIACAAQKLGRLDEAHDRFVETLQYRRDVLQTNEGVAESLLEFGRLLLEQARTKDALDRFQEALRLSETLGEKKITAQAHAEIAEACARLGDTAGAFEHFKTYHALDKDLFSEESQKRIELFHIRAAVADKEREAELLRLRADRSEQDLANSTIQLLSQSELLSSFRDNLYDILRRVPPVPNASSAWESAIHELKEKLKELPSKSIDWTKFESQFMSVHPSFKGKLLEKYPDLTKQELKMCQLARLNIKTVEMARVLCLSERTVDSHRLNLRKKVGLRKDQSLTKFLTELL